MLEQFYKVYVKSKPVRLCRDPNRVTKVEELIVPRATSITTDTETFKLKSCPDGEVTLRRMTYGQKLTRQEQAVKMTMEMQQGGGRQSARKMDMDMLQHAATLFDFAACVVDHNLEDENGQKLNLTTPRDIDRLDPRVGEEIANRIDEMNNFEGMLEESGFPDGSELP
jgi:hypothetical protein